MDKNVRLILTVYRQTQVACRYRHRKLVGIVYGCKPHLGTKKGHWKRVRSQLSFKRVLIVSNQVCIIAG